MCPYAEVCTHEGININISYSFPLQYVAFSFTGTILAKYINTYT